jgi:3'-phosphoadenosine 5'-phosphosulfate sulfotransferase (PAPS reductase)/FAD synthetase
MVQIQEASRSELVLRMMAAAARDHGPAVFVLGASAEDLLIAHVIVSARLDVEIVTLDTTYAFEMRKRLAGACDCTRTQVRRVDTLDCAVFGHNAWITSRRDASGNSVEAYEYDAKLGVLRFNPLAAWTHTHVREYLAANGVAAIEPDSGGARIDVPATQRAAA